MFLYDNVCMLYSAVERELGVLCENLLFCAVPWEESWMFLCDNVCVLCSAVGRVLGFFFFV